MTDLYDQTGRAAQIVLLGGPAAWDSGHIWIFGKTVGWLPADTEPPPTWTFSAWVPWRRDFQAYLYGYEKFDSAWNCVLYRYLGPEPFTAYDPRIALTEESP